MSFRTPFPLPSSAKNSLASALGLFVLTALTLVLGAGVASAADGFDAMTSESAFALFGDEFGDPFSSVFLNQLFGELFPAVSGSQSTTVFSSIIGYFNVTILVVAGILFFYNVTVGVVQSAHEGEVLGRNWSSLWAPIRVIFAVGLLVPIPGMGGYNTAQSGVAYIVRGATMMASTVWTASAELVITGRVAIASAPPTIDDETLRMIYLDLACQKIVNEQLAIAAAATGAQPLQVRFQPATSIENGDPEMTTWTSEVYDPVTRESSQSHICGSYETPPLPEYIRHMADDDQQIFETSSDAVRGQIATGFIQAHSDSIRLVVDGAGTTNGLRDIVNEIYPEIIKSGAPLPDITDNVSTVLKDVNRLLSTRMDGLMNRALGTDRDGQQARNALLARINGGCGDADYSAAPGSKATQCFAEGWIGAGSWYMMMAQLNNEIASLTAARSTASTGTYIANVTAANETMYVASGGTDWWGVDEDGLASAGLASQDEATMFYERFEEAWDNSVVKLAALGFPMSAEDLDGLNDNVTNADNWLAKIPGFLDALDGFVIFLMDWTSPSHDGEDPMIGLIHTGNILLGIASVLILGAIVAGATLLGTGLGPGVAFMAMPFVAVLMTAGGTLAFILPIMPFLFWVLAVTGYFLLIAEAVVAVNLWGLAHMRMDGHGISGEAGRYGWLMFLSLLVTPVLMVFGFLLGMGIFRVTSALLDIGIHQALSGILGANPLVVLIAACVYAVMISVFYMVLLERSFSLVSEFPGRVLQWMGANADLTKGEEGRVRGAAAAGAGAIYGATPSAAKIGAHGIHQGGRGLMGAARFIRGGNQGTKGAGTPPSASP